MKLLHNGVAGEPEPSGSGGRTVVVGMKLDSQSRELLTWALVKVAQPGDLVIALHVLANDEIVNKDGKSSLLSLVKAFDPVLAVYEGFCNLKQVDLKLKICRGTSARKIIVREAESYSATNVIVGTAHNHHKLRPLTSVAKYCAKKLPKDCWVLAINNGKIVFKREGSPSSIACSQGSEAERANGLLGAFNRSVSKTSKGSNLSTNQIHMGFSKSKLDDSDSMVKPSCLICAKPRNANEESREEESSNDDDKNRNSLAMVPVEKVETGSSSITMLIKKLPETRPGWPLLRRTVRSDQQGSDRSISVVEWAMRLPCRSNSTQSTTLNNHDQFSSNLDGENGAIVPVDSDYAVSTPSPVHKSSLPKELEGLHEKYLSTCRLFNYQELLSATSNFLAENLVGRGGSSQVYRGCLPDGRKLAVKILKPSEDVLKEFVLEIEIITALNHKNIVSLLGFCFEDNKFLLVYDFLSRGSLEENLHGNKKDPLAFGWNERYKVALGVAEALDYLHSDSYRPVIHRDVKSSNILLSNDFEPQLSDFGLAKWASTSSSHITCTDVAGTFGYLAPEYFMYGKVNDKIDVYAFGVVLLELLSGRKPISSDSPKGRESLVMWAKPILDGGKVSELLDPSLGDNYNQAQIERMVLAASLCIQRSPRARPQMSLALKLLKGDPNVTMLARLQLNTMDDSEMVDGETCPRSHLQSHLNLALLDVEDDSISVSSVEQTVSIKEYLQGRCSRSSSFD